MKSAAAIITVTAITAATATSVPVLDNSYCADVTEILSVDGVKDPLATNAYNLCVDGTSGVNRWSMAQSPLGSQYSIFNGTDFWTLFPDASLPGGFNCTHKYSGSEPNTIMPYTMTTIDSGADLNKTETYDAVPAQNWYVFRPGRSSGGMRIPTEYMHWHSSTGKDAHLLASECIQTCPNPTYAGKLQHGVRDQSANRTAFKERQLPSGVVCTEAPSKPHVMNGNFKSILFH